jgi:hypothetical protein
MAKETTCKHCNEVFDSKGKYEHHYRVQHQKEVKSHKIIYINIRILQIMMNNMFVFVKRVTMF